MEDCSIEVLQQRLRFGFTSAYGSVLELKNIGRFIDRAKNYFFQLWFVLANTSRLFANASTELLLQSRPHLNSRIITAVWPISTATQPLSMATKAKASAKSKFSGRSAGRN